MTLKLGSLFDGSGGFPLAGSLCGIEPIWASEVEPYPIAVTCSRFPLMEHLGSVTEVNGAEVEPVDVITFGSPCQDLSVAGKRAGLKHEANGDDETTRSGLFMEAIRIIKEMREATNGNYPKWAVWENVPGAFSSNKGEDFRIVLEELIKTVEPNAVMPAVPKNGWPYADCYYGDGWSIAYRVLDAQYIRTAQRRRRIYLVLHLTGQRAGSVLFERESLRGNTPQGGTPRKTTAGDVTDCIGTTNREGEEHIPYTLKIRSGCEGGGKGALIQTDKSATLSTLNDQYLFHPITYDARGNGDGETVSTLTGDHENRITDYTSVVVEPVAYSFDSLASNSMKSSNPHSGCRQVEVAKCLDTTDPNPCKNQGGIAVLEPRPVYCLQGNGIDRADTAGCNGKGWKEDTCYTLNTIDRPAVVYGVEHKAECLDVGFFNSYEEQSPTLLARGYKDPHLVAYPNDEARYIVRRLTPTECARLQGFPDKWGHPTPMDSITDGDYRFWLNVRKTHAAINGKSVKDFTEQQIMTWYNKLHTDSSEYKMWGNGIALPCALYVMEGIAEESKNKPEMEGI